MRLCDCAGVMAMVIALTMMTNKIETWNAITSIIAGTTVDFSDEELLAFEPPPEGQSRLNAVAPDFDGGTFTVLLQDDGRVKLVNDQGGFTVVAPGSGMEEEGAELFPIDPKDDHAAFLMSATTGGLCDADW